MKPLVLPALIDSKFYPLHPQHTFCQQLPLGECADVMASVALFWRVRTSYRISWASGFPSVHGGQVEIERWDNFLGADRVRHRILLPPPWGGHSLSLHWDEFELSEGKAA